MRSAPEKRLRQHMTRQAFSRAVLSGASVNLKLWCYARKVETGLPIARGGCMAVSDSLEDFSKTAVSHRKNGLTQSPHRISAGVRTRPSKAMRFLRRLALTCTTLNNATKHILLSALQKGSLTGRPRDTAAALALALDHTSFVAYCRTGAPHRRLLESLKLSIPTVRSGAWAPAPAA